MIPVSVHWDKKFSSWCFFAGNKSGKVMLARHYPFLIDTILRNYPFGGTPMGQIILQMCILYALLNLCGIFADNNDTFMAKFAK